MDSFSIYNNNFLPDFTWKIRGIKELMASGRFEIESEEFEWKEYPGVRARAKLELKMDDYADDEEWWHISLRFNEPDGGEYPDDVRFNPTIFYVVKDRSERQRHYVQPSLLLFGSKFTHSHNYLETVGGEDRLTTPPYNEDDSVVIEIYVQPPPMARMVHSTDGTLDWTIEQCSARKEAESSALIEGQESPYFYTAPRGHRLQAHLCFSSADEDKWVTANVTFLAGEFDARGLSTAFPHTTTVTLTNPQHPECYVTKTVQSERIREARVYSLNMCKEDELQRLIVDGVLLCKVVVKPKLSFYNYLTNLLFELFRRIWY